MLSFLFLQFIIYAFYIILWIIIQVYKANIYIHPPDRSYYSTVFLICQYFFAKKMHKNSKKFYKKRENPYVKPFLLYAYFLNTCIKIQKMLPYGNIFLKFSSQIFTVASDGILKSPLGESPTLPTLTPSGLAVLLNC